MLGGSSSKGRSPQSPALTPRDFFLWGFVKDTVFVPPLPCLFPGSSQPITSAVALVDCDMLAPMWDKMDYHIDACHISKGEHIKQL